MSPFDHIFLITVVPKAFSRFSLKYITHNIYSRSNDLIWLFVRLRFYTVFFDYGSHTHMILFKFSPGL